MSDDPRDVSEGLARKPLGPAAPAIVIEEQKQLTDRPGDRHPAEALGSEGRPARHIEQDGRRQRGLDPFRKTEPRPVSAEPHRAGPEPAKSAAGVGKPGKAGTVRIEEGAVDRDQPGAVADRGDQCRAISGDGPRSVRRAGMKA